MDVPKLTAELCHQANRAFCQYIGDNSHPDWENAEPWQVSSAIEGVNVFLKGGVSTPEDQWKAWKAHKISEGWVYGDIKNVDLRQHPCIVDTYDQLPEDQRFKDELFQTICKVKKKHATN